MADNKKGGAKKKKGRFEEKESYWSSINPVVKNRVTAVFLLGVDLILILAIFGQAGPVGKFLYSIFTDLFGWGYYSLLLILFILSILLFWRREKKRYSLTLISATIFFLSTLGLIDIISADDGGVTGKLIGLIEVPFGGVAGLIVLIIAAIGSLLIMLDIPFSREIKDSGNDSQKNNDIGDLQVKNAFAESIPLENYRQPKEKIELAKTITKSALDKFKKSKSAATKRGNYIAPPLSLLTTSAEKPTAGDLRANANIIKRTLESFGIPVEMGEINIGPKVTRYTLKPAEGVKLTRITALNQDLSLALAAHPLRIEAPIPGKSLVGIEVPNKSAAIVHLGSLMSYPEFAKSGPLSFVIGRDVNGDPIAANIEKMPHCLISGSTGSGKSILIHSIITSLLYKNSPDSLRLVMIDPKRVELSIYNDIPHLVAPVITDGKKAINVFRWAIQEMDDRYETLLKSGARDIGSYNAKSKEQMPYLVIFVDELADLMAAHGREIETAVVRLAQMSRATGIHLILSTQRPSVEVITGLIKANITTRVALQVASQVDSRTILDMAGAEKLLGGGDMLLISSEFSKPKRIQGPYLSEKELRDVAEFIKKNNQPDDQNQKSDDLLKENKPLPDNGNIKKEINFDNFQSEAGEPEDELFNDAVEVIRSAQKASASLLQRRLKVGYARAARLLDMMEEKGLIGPGEGARAREVFISANPRNNTVENTDADVV